MAQTDTAVATMLLADLGNFAPTSNQIDAVASWIAGEKPNGGSDLFSNNPLNISVSGTPAQFGATAPQPNAQPSNPIAQFSDLSTGLLANAQRLAQPFAAGIKALLATPQNISTSQLGAAVSASGWGTGAFGNPGNAYPNAQSNSNFAPGTAPEVGSQGPVGQTGGSSTTCQPWSITWPGILGGATNTFPGTQIFCQVAGFFGSGGWGKIGLTVAAGLLIILGGTIYLKGETPRVAI